MIGLDMPRFSGSPTLVAAAIDSALLIFLCFFIGSLEASDCPAQAIIRPCKCLPLSSSDVNVQCISIRRPEDLVAPIQTLGRSKTRVYQLKIENSSLSYLPADLFKGAHIEQVQFVNTKIMSLSEHGTPFSGLENILEAIDSFDVDFVTGLHLDQFRNLKKLKSIYFSRCRMHAAVHSLPYLPDLRMLIIERSDISYISNNAFVDLPNLSTLSMTGNKIAEMKRSMFPNPAKELSWINLSGNMLSSLPNDFFENMPNLRLVFLSENKFLSLQEKPFADVFRNNGLQTFWMQDNPLHCDCKISWLGSVGIPERFYAKCATPADVAGKSITSLDFESLCNSGVLQLLLAIKMFPTS